MLLIGSNALEVRAPSLLQKAPLDVDLMGTYEEFQQIQARVRAQWSTPNRTGSKITIKSSDGQMCEFELAWEDSTCATLLDLVRRDPETRISQEWFGKVFIPSLNVLFALKSSHRFVSGPHFLKTMVDWRRMREAGACIPAAYTSWFEARQRETLQRKHPRLDTSRMKFFNPALGVNYVYDHDSIHRAVAYAPNLPAYLAFQKLGSEVMCDRTLFFAQEESTRLHSVAEEAYVLAIERSHVPHGTLSPKAAFDIALEKVCTTISSGWWREFAYENYSRVQEIYRDDYLERFQKALQWGKIPPFQKSGESNAVSIYT